MEEISRVFNSTWPTKFNRTSSIVDSTIDRCGLIFPFGHDGKHKHKDQSKNQVKHQLKNQVKNQGFYGSHFHGFHRFYGINGFHEVHGTHAIQGLDTMECNYLFLKK